MKRTKATDLLEIAAALDGKVDFQKIQFSQVLIVEKGESVNDLLFVAKKWGVYFYTSRSSFNNICYLSSKNEFPTLVVAPGSKNVYQISE